MFTFISPIMPFAATLLPRTIVEFVKIGYVTPQLSEQAHLFSTTFKQAGGLIYIIESLIIVVVILVALQKHFCSKDL